MVFDGRISRSTSGMGARETAEVRFNVPADSNPGDLVLIVYRREIIQSTFRLIGTNDSVLLPSLLAKWWEWIAVGKVRSSEASSLVATDFMSGGRRTRACGIRRILPR